MSIKDRIIVALDVSTLDELKSLVETLSPFVGCFKVGLELITSVGASLAVQTIQQTGGKVFLDGKFHDIPNTVEAASRSAAQLGVKMFNVHASSGREAMRRADLVKGDSLLLAVTLLTSTDDQTCRLIYNQTLKQQVISFAKDAQDCQLDGIICSAEDLSFLQKEETLHPLLKITPGIRPTWAQSNDQKRTLTPKQAILAGSDYLVMGRPITHPPQSIGSPAEAAQRILDELGEVL